MPWLRSSDRLFGVNLVLGSLGWLPLLRSSKETYDSVAATSEKVDSLCGLEFTAILLLLLIVSLHYSCSLAVLGFRLCWKGLLRSLVISGQGVQQEGPLGLESKACSDVVSQVFSSFNSDSHHGTQDTIRCGTSKTLRYILVDWIVGDHYEVLSSM